MRITKYEVKGYDVMICVYQKLEILPPVKKSAIS